MPANDVQRFERIVLPHLDDAYTLARYLLRDQHDAQDAVQDAVLRALRYFETYREGDARAWLLAIVRNCCLTRHRKAQAERANIAFVEDIDVVHEARGARYRRSGGGAIRARGAPASARRTAGGVPRGHRVERSTGTELPRNQRRRRRPDRDRDVPSGESPPPVGGNAGARRAGGGLT